MRSKNIQKLNPTDGLSLGLNVKPLISTFGAEVFDLDFRGAIVGETRRALKQALMNFQVLLIRGQFLDEDQQVHFAEIFGPCRAMWQNPQYPATNRLTHYLSNVDRAGIALNSHPDPNSVYWHSDGSWAPQPPIATILNAVQVPESGGDTQFANMYQIYEGLHQADKDRLGKIRAEHHVDISRATRYRRWPWQWWPGESGYDKPLRQLLWWRNVLLRRWREGVIKHPLVRPHPVTGRPALFIGDHAWRVTDTPLPRGIRLMREINGMDINHEAIYTHRWQAGDLVVWDNGSLLHRVMPYDLTAQVRIMRRCVALA